MYCRGYKIALSNIGRTGMEVGRHLGDDPTTTSQLVEEELFYVAHLVCV